MTPVARSTSGARRLGRGGSRWLCLAPLALCLAGCVHGAIRPNQLPADLVVAPAIDVQTLDLSNLAGGALVNDRIYAGDTIDVRVVTGAERNRRPETWPLRVEADGRVDVPLVGSIHVADLDVLVAADVIRRASIDRGVYRNPNVTVAINRRRENRITVVGAVAKPGTYPLPMANSDLFTALASAGGLAKDADRTVEIRQSPTAVDSAVLQAQFAAAHGAPGAFGAMPHLQPPGGDVAAHMPMLGPAASQAASRPARKIDLVSATKQTNEDYRLDDGAVVMVMRQPQRVVHVTGLVNRPQRIVIPPGEDMRMLDALSAAGGPRFSFADKVYVMRNTRGEDEQKVIQISVAAAKSDADANIRLAAGDVVSVEETPATFAMTTVRQFIRISVNAAGRIPLF